MKGAVAVLVGFVHDFSAGLWAATVLAVWWLERGIVAHAGAAQVLQGLQRNFFWMGVAFTAVVMVTGAGRGFTYVDNFYGPGAEAPRRKMLVVKHVILVTVFGLGTWWEYRMAFS